MANFEVKRIYRSQIYRDGYSGGGAGGSEGGSNGSNGGDSDGTSCDQALARTKDQLRMMEPVVTEAQVKDQQ